MPSIVAGLGQGELSKNGHIFSDMSNIDFGLEQGLPGEKVNWLPKWESCRQRMMCLYRLHQSSVRADQCLLLVLLMTQMLGVSGIIL